MEYKKSNLDPIYTTYTQVTEELFDETNIDYSATKNTNSYANAKHNYTWFNENIHY